MMFHGVGAYPTDSYYDPARPAWLPYWIDDATESQNKYALAMMQSGIPGAVVAGAALVTAPGVSPYANPSAPATVQPPNMVTDPTGAGVNIDEQIAAAQTATIAQNLAVASQQAAATPVDNSSVGGMLNNINSVLGGGNPNSLLGQYGAELIIGGVALFALVMVAGKVKR